MDGVELPEALQGVDGVVPLGTRLGQLAADRPDETALWFPTPGGTRAVTYREFDERSTQVARGMVEAGVGVGDRVGIRIRNSPEHFVAALAAWKVGAVPVPVRWDLPDWELDRVLGVLDAALVVDLDHPVLTGTRDLSTDPLPEVVPPHTSGVLSSGSTGSPKVILRLMPGVFVPGTGSNQLVEAYGPLGPQVIAVPAPLYHTNGFMALTNLLAGDRLVLLERFDAGRLLAAIEDHAVTGMVATTVMLQRLVQDEGFERCDLSSLEWVMHGAAPLPEWLARRWIERVGPESFFVCYGSSEALGTTFARGDEYLDHPGTVGRPAVGTEVRILDDAGGLLPAGAIGHIHLRSEHGVLAAYLGDVPPVPVTPDGFATVGDMGWLDADGYLHLADRRVDLIITGGANVYPAEVEAALSEHADVADVVVIGLTDPEWGRRVHAVVEPRADGRVPGRRELADELRTWCSDRLARYKVPKTFEFVDRIPRSEATKVNRAALVAEREAARPRADRPDGAS